MDDGSLMENFAQVGRDEKWLVPYSEVEFGKQIGEGAFCNVHECQWRQSTIVAKKLKKEQHIIMELLSEIWVLRTVRHPNIVMFLGACSAPDGTPIMLLEHVNGKTLRNFIADRPSFKSRYSAASQLALALSFCHQCNPPVIYRDLKPDNCMVDKRGDVKLLDFGLSKLLPSADLKGAYKLTGGTGSQRFMAPEVYNRSRYGLSADVYSFGLLLFFIFSGEMPFSGADPRGKLDRFRRGDQTALGAEAWITNTTLRKLVLDCTSADPATRPSMADVYDTLKTVQPRKKSLSLRARFGSSPGAKDGL